MGTTEHLETDTRAFSGHDLLTVEEADRQAAAAQAAYRQAAAEAERIRRAHDAARCADMSQATADALDKLHELIHTDERFEVLRDSGTSDAIRRDARDFEADAEECRLQALRLGYVPR